MLKVIALLKKRDDITKSEMITYYENNHVPLIRSLTNHIVSYKRNYVDLEGSIFYENVSSLDFDVITEFLFKDREAYNASLADFTNPDAAQRIAADEENIFDRSMTRFFIVEEYE